MFSCCGIAHADNFSFYSAFSVSVLHLPGCGSTFSWSELQHNFFLVSISRKKEGAGTATAANSSLEGAEHLKSEQRQRDRWK